MFLENIFGKIFFPIMLNWMKKQKQQQQQQQQNV